MLTILVVLGAALAADCERPTSATDVSTHVDDALLAFATLDEEGVLTAAESASTDIACLGEVIPVRAAAASHRLVGIRSFMEGDAEAAVAAFQAARRLQPEYELSDKIAPEGGKLHRLYQDAANAPTPFAVAAAPPAGLDVWVDGTKTPKLGHEYPSIVQYTTPDGEVVWSGYVAAGSKPPSEVEGYDPRGPVASADDDWGAEEDDDWGAEEEDDGWGEQPETGGWGTTSEPDRDEPAREERGRDEPARERDEPEAAEEERPLTRRERAALEREEAPIPTDLRDPRDEVRSGGGGKGAAIAGVATGVVAAGLFGTSVVTRMSFDEEPTQTKFHLTNGTYWGSIGMGAVSVGLFGVAILSGEF